MMSCCPQSNGFRCLKNGETVEYDQLDSDKGLQGRNVRISDVMSKSKPVEQKAEV